ncbi:MAG: radical SAM protein [Nitrospirae bacterium]|nr:radical SAM protein [Nitrospirota bacterium]
MSRVLLLNPPGRRRYIRDNYCSHVSKGRYLYHPIDLLVQSGILRARGEQSTVIGVLDAIAEGLKPEEGLRRVQDFRPDFVLSLAGIVSWPEDAVFLSAVKHATRAEMALTGDKPLFEWPEMMDRLPWMDAVLLDYTTDAFARHVFDGHAARGLALRGARRPARAGPEMGPPNRVVNVPPPFWDAFPLSRYRLMQARHHPFMTVFASLGCPWRCTFCPMERIPFVRRDLSNLLEELDQLRRLGYREIKFRDQTFGADRDYYEQLCRGMIAYRLGFGWSCETRTDVVDYPFLSLMKEAGCHTVMMGVETSTQNVLRHTRKGQRPGSVPSAFQACRELGMKSLAHFIIGLPGETPETTERLVEYALQLRPTYAAFNVAGPAPGTTLLDRALAQGWLRSSREAIDNSDSYPPMELPGFSSREVWTWHRRAVRKFYLSPSTWLRMASSVRTFREWLCLFSEAVSLLQRILVRALRWSPHPPIAPSPFHPTAGPDHGTAVPHAARDVLLSRLFSSSPTS